MNQSDDDSSSVNSVSVSAGGEQDNIFGAGRDDPSAPIRSVRDLRVFRMAHEAVLRIYEITRRFPAPEARGLTSQLRRAAASVPANLVEGAARNHRGEYRQFVGIARASAAEVSYHLLLARDLGLIEHDEHLELDDRCDQIGRMLTRLAQALAPRTEDDRS